MIQRTLSILLISILIFSCEQEKKTTFDNVKHIKTVNITQNIHLKIDSIVLDNIECSLSGKSQIKNDTIYFADEQFGWIFKFDKKGKYISKNLGKGNGPKELSTGFIDSYIKTKKQHIFIGSANDISIHNNNFNRTKHFVINWNGQELSPMKIKDKNAEYSLAWHALNSVEHNNFLYVPIYVDSSSEFPAILQKQYYQELKTIAKIDLNNGKVSKLIGGYPHCFTTNREIPHMSFTYFDVDKQGNLYVIYKGDSLIYKTNSDFEKIYSFGQAGKNMNTDYTKVKNIKEFVSALRNDEKNCGYYNSIKHIDEKDYIIRSYTKGPHSKNDGLQIYSKEQLVADIDVPKGFKTGAYIAPYIYSEIKIDQENEKMIVYRVRVE